MTMIAILAITIPTIWSADSILETYLDLLTNIVWEGDEDGIDDFWRGFADGFFIDSGLRVDAKVGLRVDTLVTTELNENNNKSAM